MTFSKDDSLRVKGIAIILLIFHHMCYRASFFEQYAMKIYLPQARVIDLAVLARICVFIFAFVSSYGLATLFTKDDTQSRPGAFVAKRWLSLMSAWWFAYPVQVIATLLSGKELGAIFKGNVIYVLLDILGWSDFFHTPMIAGINWYMSLSQLIIVLTPLLCLISKKFKSVSILYAFIAVQVLRSVHVSDFGGDYANYLITIVAGNYLATNEVFRKLQIKKHWRAVIISGLVFVAAMSARYFISKRAAGFQKHTSGLMALAVVALCIGVSLVLRKDVVFKFLGKHSGNMYFVHIFIVRSVLLHKYVSYVPLLILISIAGSLALSVLMEWVKKLVHYDLLFRRIIAGIDKKTDKSCVS